MDPELELEVVVVPPDPDKEKQPLVDSPKKEDGEQGCSCKKGKCDGKGRGPKFSCFKAGNSCSSSCGCVECNNQEEKTEVNGPKDPKDEKEKLEDRMDITLKDGDWNKIKNMITPQNLTKCKTNCLEKSLEVSQKLKRLADAKGPNADVLSTLGKSVEDFAFQLLEPLKSDDEKRDRFEKRGFDCLFDKAVKYQQKKFVSHPVVHDLMTTQRWTGNFCHPRYSKNWFKWFLLNFWTFFDVVLFPLVHVFLWIIHLIIEFANKGQGIKGKYIYDCYVQYFTTPYFIFFRDTLSYLALLGLHFAMCLQPSTVHFTPVEWIISVFFLGRFMNEINQLIVEQNSGWTNKEAKNNTKLKKLWGIVSIYFDDWWNILDVVTLIVFLVVFGLRIFICSQHSSVSQNRLLAVAGYLYGMNAMFLTLRVFGNIMESKQFTGSIQIALFQVIGAVIVMFGQFLVAIVAFSFAITKIYVTDISYHSGKNSTSSGLCGPSQNGLECWWSFTRHLAWSLLGISELSPLQSSDDTSDNFARFLYGLFLIMAVVMLMNMMIALLSNTYQQVEDNAFYEWSFKKATTIRTYLKYHPVPVPFNIISLFFIMLRHFYRRCTNYNKNKKTEEENETNKKTEEENETQFHTLVEKLKNEYFATYGHTFPISDKKRMELGFEETKGNRKMNGIIAQRVFCYNQKEVKQLKSHGDPEWDHSKDIVACGQRLELPSCQCGIENHGARYCIPLSEEFPKFEVLIKETVNGKPRLAAIGVVTKDYELDDFPGWYGNSAGYHIDDGKIFDQTIDHRYGQDSNDGMVHRGDLIGCEIRYDKQENNKLPVFFTLNGRFVGEASLNPSTNKEFYPFVGIGTCGISLLFRMCPKVTLPGVDPVLQMLETVSELQAKIEKLDTISKQLQTASDRLTELECKMDSSVKI